MKHILKCQNCDEYTMNEKCKCKGKAINIKPQRYSPGRFAKYRQDAKRKLLSEKGLL